MEIYTLYSLEERHRDFQKLYWNSVCSWDLNAVVCGLDLTAHDSHLNALQHHQPPA